MKTREYFCFLQRSNAPQFNSQRKQFLTIFCSMSCSLTFHVNASQAYYLLKCMKSTIYYGINIIYCEATMSWYSCNYLALGCHHHAFLINQPTEHHYAKQHIVYPWPATWFFFISLLPFTSLNSYIIHIKTKQNKHATIIQKTNLITVQAWSFKGKQESKLQPLFNYNYTQINDAWEFIKNMYYTYLLNMWTVIKQLHII